MVHSDEQNANIKLDFSMDSEDDGPRFFIQNANEDKLVIKL